MLNPDSGIKIYRYTTVSDSDMAKYLTKMKEITHTLFADWLEHQSVCDKIKGTKLENLCRYMS
jgi:hypothetical protein